MKNRWRYKGGGMEVEFKGLKVKIGWMIALVAAVFLLSLFDKPMQWPPLSVPAIKRIIE